MSTSTHTIEELAGREDQYGFITDVEQDAAPRGITEDIVRFISRRSTSPTGSSTGVSKCTARG